ncbi:HNH endonuclease [Epilithonimonas arachidiradicis]|uniref:HNH endonuclease n=1 Tax=Epilithonimonas arachidiradicis TaxID=1617282 RepID=A0A420DAI6_9FLAO|nr:HNH endonuclease [Epilithonimonas arachidiradicis]RKE88154.1 HNH endonuclease [Epilithonimonas arachidiradicis]GGG50950.1 hypothetical protein GCM10007332_10760 [Epilithonimonas arachidiradicis]
MVYTSEELQIIEQAKSEGGDIWKNKILDPIKRRIKTHYRTNDSEQCCYCKRDFQDEFNMVIDIEHILPKANSLFKEYMFDIENLNISCKRCNMTIKNDRIDFIVDLKTIKPDYRISNKYFFIHPNFDNYFDHIDYEATIRNNKKLIKYIKKTEKGKYTYNYFHLDRIEIDTFDNVQGVKIQGVELNPDLPEDTKSAFKALATKL